MLHRRKNVTHAGWGNLPKPVGMTQKTMAGRAIGCQCALYLDTTSSPALQGSVLNTVGTLLVGYGLQTDTYQESGLYIYHLNDGSNLKPDASHTGLKVISWEGSVAPQSWAQTTTGPQASSEQRLPIPCPFRSSAFRALHLGVSITTPPGNELNLVTGATSVVISGLATAPGTGVASVYVKIGSAGQWQDVTSSYNRGAHTWSYTWTNPSTNTIYARAMDTWGNSLETNKSVTVAANLNVIYVNPNGNDSWAGTTWATAKRNISGTNGAMAAASSGKEVWVAAGEYTESATVTLKLACAFMVALLAMRQLASKETG